MPIRKQTRRTSAKRILIKTKNSMSNPIEEIILQGASGKKYLFLVYPLGNPLPSSGGIYFISNRSEKGIHSPIYIGESSNLLERFQNHHKAECFEKKGANCLSIYPDNSEFSES